MTLPRQDKLSWLVSSSAPKTKNVKKQEYETKKKPADLFHGKKSPYLLGDNEESDQLFESSVRKSKQPLKSEPLKNRIEENENVSGVEKGAQEEKEEERDNLENCSEMATNQKLNLADFIEKKKEMFLLEYALNVLRDENKRLERDMSLRERTIEQNLVSLYDQAEDLDSQLKKKLSVVNEIKKSAEDLTKAKINLQEQLRVCTLKCSRIGSELVKHEDKLTEYRQYKTFLDRHTPKEFFEQNEKADVLYFTEPQQLIDLFESLEHRSMFLVHEGQEDEQTYESTREYTEALTMKITKNTTILENRLIELNGLIENEHQRQERAKKELEKFRDEIAQKTMPEKEELVESNIGFHIKSMYRTLIKDDCATKTSIQMLAALEQKMNNLFLALEGFSQGVVISNFSEKEMIRRNQARKMKSEQLMEEEKQKIEKAIERSSRVVQRQVGKATMVRTYLPPRIDRRGAALERKLKEEEEDKEYFGLL